MKNIVNWMVKRFGTADPRRLISPTVYPEAELRSDLITLQQACEEAESEVSELYDELDGIYEEGADAPEYKRQALAERADVVESSLTHKKAAYQAKSRKLGLLRAIQGVRERMGSEDVHLDEYLEEADSGEITAEIRAELTNLRMESQTIDEIKAMLQVSTTQSRSATSADTKKHLDRMEQRGEDHTFDSVSDVDRDRDDSSAASLIND